MALRDKMTFVHENLQFVHFFCMERILCYDGVEERGQGSLSEGRDYEKRREKVFSIREYPVCLSHIVSEMRMDAAWCTGNYNDTFGEQCVEYNNDARNGSQYHGEGNAGAFYACGGRNAFIVFTVTLYR